MTLATICMGFALAVVTLLAFVDGFSSSER
jgi:hypothetical protein